MRSNNFIYVFILLLFLVGISCVSAENTDDVNYLSTDDSVEVISVDENNVLADSATSTIVYNWTELGSAVSKDKNFETVYLGANIIPGEQIKIDRNVTIIGSADTYIGGGNSTDPVSYSAIPIYSNENGLSITLKDIRFQNSKGNILMQFSGNGTYVIDNCSFVNVNATGSHQAVVYLNLGYMDILNCTFENCTTSYGAVSNYNERSVKNVHMTVRDTTFKKNHATTEPGCINNCGQLEVYDSTFEENSAAWWAGAIHTHYNAETTIVGSNFIGNAAKSSYNGGALYTYGTLTVIDSNFTGNRAPNGGAIAGMNYMSRASVSLKNCEFRNNTASGSGGAVLFPGAQFVVEDSRFYDNVAGGSGGALSISAAVSNITNCEFRSNRAHNAQNNSKGGALNFASTDGSLVGCVFEDCSSDNGGSVYWANDDGVMSGCSFVNSHADNNGGAVYWAGDNGLVEKSSFEKCSADNYGGGIYFEGENCTLADSAFNGNSASNGSNWYSVEPLNVTNMSSVITVYTWDELASGVQNDVVTTIYIGANLTQGKQININHNVTIIGSADTYIGGGNSTDPVSYSAIPIYSNENGLSITLKDIRFQNSKGNILMQFSGNGTYVIDNCSFVNVNATGSHQAVVYLNLGYMDILNCTFENCTTSYGAVSNYNERSVKNVHMTVRDTTFKKNHATTEPGCINNCGQLEVYDSTFEENSAAWWAGAIHTHYNAETTIVGSNFIGNAAKSSYNGGALYTYGTLTVIDSNFTGNRAPNGGAIAGMNYMSRASVSLKNCEFRNNTASGSGGAVLFPGAQFVVEDSRFYDNVAGGSGGALSISAAVSNITNCEFRSNRAHNAQNNSKGGALNFASTDGSLVGCVFEDCSSDNGGSVYWANDDGVMSGCSFVNSHADNNGGAVYWAGDNGLVEKSSFEKCSADNYGGGIYFEGENCTLADSTFGINDALEGLNWYSVEPLKVINVTTLKIQTAISAPDVNIIYGNTANLTVTLMDENKTALAGENITVSFNNNIYNGSTDENGQVIIPIPSNLIPDVYIANISYNGTEKYDSSKTTAEVTINKISTALTAADVVTVYNSGVKLIAVLNDENGSVISGSKVKIVLGSLSKTLITDADGQVSLSMDAVVPGNYTAEIEFAGDEIYNPATAIAKVSISKLDSTLNANDIVTIYNNGDKLVATLEDGNGSAIGGMQVKISLGAITKTLITDANGQISLSTDGLLPDNYSAEIVFAGDEIYNHANTTAKVTIDKLNSTLTSSDVITVYNSGDKLVASLMDGNGSAISGAKVKILLDTISKTLITDANGQVSLTTSALLPGNYSAEIVFAGDEIYDYSSTNVNVVISKLNSILNATDVVTVYNGGKKLVAILNDAEGNAIGGAQITIELGDISNTLITDENGQVALSTDGLVPDIYTADIIFAGDEIYAESSTSADVTVLPLGSEIIAEVSAEYTVVEVVNDSAVFNLVLIDENGNCLSNKTIDIEFNGIIENFTTDDEGKIEYLISAEAGNYTLVMTFAGDDCYTESNASAEITVVPVKTEIIAPESIEYTIDEVIIGNATFNLVLIDEYGNAVTNMPVNITFNGITEEVTTDENGVASYIINAAAGNYTIDMAFGADGYYEASNASSTVIIKDEQKKQSKIFLRNALYFVTQTKMVNVTLWDENNTPIAGKTVHITIGNSTWSGITNVNGTASIRVGIGYGNHNATVHFDGDDQYVASNRTGVVRVIKETPSVMVRGADTQFKADDNNKVVKVYLRDRYDKALPEGSKIVFKLNGKTYIGFTDINGVASIKININTVGTFNAQAMYGGNSAYNPVTRDVKIRIV